MSTTLSNDFLRTLVLVHGFRGEAIDRACAGLLLMGLRGIDFDAGMLPGEICGDDPHLAGMPCASLCAQKLIVGVGRVKSSSPLANGRKVNLWRIPSDRTNAARTWLDRHGIDATPQDQLSLAI